MQQKFIPPRKSNEFKSFTLSSLLLQDGTHSHFVVVGLSVVDDVPEELLEERHAASLLDVG